MALKEETNGHNYFNRGLTNMKLGICEDAAKDFELALKIYQAKDDPTS